MIKQKEVHLHRDHMGLWFVETEVNLFKIDVPLIAIDEINGWFSAFVRPEFVAELIEVLLDE